MTGHEHDAECELPDPFRHAPAGLAKYPQPEIEFSIVAALPQS